MRSKNSIRNAIIGVISYLIIMISNFVTRSFFIKELGLEIAGIESLYKNIISMLALAELGIGTGLVYKLYDPIAKNDNIRIKKILNFYKSTYLKISFIVLLCGSILCFIVPFFVKENISKTYLGILFFLFVLDVLASYLYSNRKVLITADQKNYLISINDAIIQFLTMIVQISFLLMTSNFIIYMVIKILCRLVGAFLIAQKFRDLYPDIYKIKDKSTISIEESKDLKRNIGAMLCHKVSAFFVTSSSSIYITYFISASINGIYANYTLITTTLMHLINQVFNGITASFGNLLYTDTRERILNQFNTLYLLNYFIYSFCTVSIFVLIDPFIEWWIGTNSLFTKDTVVLLLLYFYLYGIRRVILMTKDSAGMYEADKYMALLEAAINVILALVLVNYIGINGVIIANILSIVLVPLWTQPYIVYKNILFDSLYNYYKRYLLYFILTIFLSILTYMIANLFVNESLFLIIVFRALICLIIPNVFNLILFYRTKEFQTIKNILLHIIK